MFKSTHTIVGSARVAVVVAIVLACAEITPAYARQSQPIPLPATWTTTGSMQFGRSQHTATRLQDGRVLIAGGWYYVDEWGYGYPPSEIYDPALGAWSMGGYMISARGNHTATLLSDGRVLVAGGYDGANTLASAEIYAPTLGTWSPTGSMSTPHGRPWATRLADGRVLVTGDGSPEIYNPVVGTWSPAGLMAAPSSGPATLLSDGRVLVMASGGITQLFDPALGTWSLTGSMGTPPRHDDSVSGRSRARRGRRLRGPFDHD